MNGICRPSIFSFQKIRKQENNKKEISAKEYREENVRKNKISDDAGFDHLSTAYAAIDCLCDGIEGW
jgi:hypothetical protein